MQTEPHNTVKGTTTLHLEIATVTFRAPDTGYAVLRCRNREASGKNATAVTVTGTFPDIREGMSIFADGEWIHHPRFGRQFRADGWREELPATESGIRKYLSSGLVYGIGPVLADRLVDTFGKDTFDIIENEPQRLYEVPGVGKKKIESILKKWNDQKTIRDIMVFLKDHGVSDNLAAKIHRRYGDDAIRVLKENPYRMADDIWGVGFRIADNLPVRVHHNGRPARHALSDIVNHVTKPRDADIFHQAADAAALNQPNPEKRPFGLTTGRPFLYG